MARPHIKKELESLRKSPYLSGVKSPTRSDVTGLAKSGAFTISRQEKESLQVFNPWNVFNGSFVPEAVSRIPIRFLSFGAKLAYGRLLRYAGREGVARPRIDVLAVEIGSSGRNVSRFISELSIFGLVKPIRKGLRQSNRYVFLWHPIFDKSPNMTDSACLDMTDPAYPTIEESQIEESDFEKSKSSLFLKVNKKVMDDDIVSVDEDGNEIVNGPWGRPLKKVAKVPRAKKNEIALRIIKKFKDLCTKNLESTPMEHIKNYMIVLNAMSKGGLSEEQIYDLFEEWFLLGKPDDEAIQITRALSANQINGYKARNQIK